MTITPSRNFKPAGLVAMRRLPELVTQPVIPMGIRTPQVIHMLTVIPTMDTLMRMALDIRTSGLGSTAAGSTVGALAAGSEAVAANPFR